MVVPLSVQQEAVPLGVGGAWVEVPADLAISSILLPIGVKTSQLHAVAVGANARLDAKYFLSPGVLAAERMRLLQSAGIETRSVGGSGGFGYARGCGSASPPRPSIAGRAEDHGAGQLSPPSGER
jgi:hypothetical protein